MQEHWEKLGTEVENLNEVIKDLLEILPQSAKFHAQTNKVKNQWRKLQHAFNELDPFISPVKSVEVASALLKHQELSIAWATWKDYLQEQHGLFMRSRAEVAALKRLSEISGANVATAIRYLEFAMSRMDRNFYVVNETEAPATKTADGKPASALVVKLPVQYTKAPSGSPDGGEEGKEKIPDKPATTFSIKQEVEKFKKHKNSPRP